tara:strand:+ start:261 stop:2054 length:1794 start_codon:yes stop_codon:yes gene_type:complete
VNVPLTEAISEIECDLIQGPDFPEGPDDYIKNLQEYANRLKDSNCSFMIKDEKLPYLEENGLIVYDANFMYKDKYLNKTAKELLEDAISIQRTFPLTAVHYLSRSIELNPDDWKPYYIRANIISSSYKGQALDQVTYGGSYYGGCAESVANVPLPKLYPQMYTLGPYTSTPCDFGTDHIAKSITGCDIDPYWGTTLSGAPCYEIVDMFIGALESGPYFLSQIASPGVNIELIWALNDIEKAIEKSKLSDNLFTTEDEKKLVLAEYRLRNQMQGIDNTEKAFSSMENLLTQTMESNDTSNGTKCRTLGEAIYLIEDQMRRGETQNKLQMITYRNEYASIQDSVLEKLNSSNKVDPWSIQCIWQINYYTLANYYIDLSEEEFDILHPNRLDNKSQLSYASDYIDKYIDQYNKIIMSIESEVYTPYITTIGRLSQMRALKGELSESELEKDMTKISNLTTRNFFSNYANHAIDYEIGWFKFMQKDYELAHFHFSKASKIVDDLGSYSVDDCSDKFGRFTAEKSSYCSNMPLYMSALTYEFILQNPSNSLTNYRISKYWDSIEGSQFLKKEAIQNEFIFRGWSDIKIEQIFSKWEKAGFFN